MRPFSLRLTLRLCDGGAASGRQIKAKQVVSDASLILAHKIPVLMFLLRRNASYSLRNFVPQPCFTTHEICIKNLFFATVKNEPYSNLHKFEEVCIMSECAQN